MVKEGKKLTWLRIKDAKLHERSRILKKFSLVVSKLLMNESGIHIMRQRATDQHQAHKKEVRLIDI